MRASISSGGGVTGTGDTRGGTTTSSLGRAGGVMAATACFGRDTDGLGLAGCGWLGGVFGFGFSASGAIYTMPFSRAGGGARLTGSSRVR